MAISDAEQSFARLVFFPQCAGSPWICLTLVLLRKAPQPGRNPRSRLESPYLEVPYGDSLVEMPDLLFFLSSLSRSQATGLRKQDEFSRAHSAGGGGNNLKQIS